MMSIYTPAHDCLLPLQKYLEAQHLTVFYKTSVALLEKEVEVVKKALGSKWRLDTMSLRY
jgi:hypothetical protein